MFKRVKTDHGKWVQVDIDITNIDIKGKLLLLTPQIG